MSPASEACRVNPMDCQSPCCFYFTRLSLPQNAANFYPTILTVRHIYREKHYTVSTATSSPPSQQMPGTFISEYRSAAPVRPATLTPPTGSVMVCLSSPVSSHSERLQHFSETYREPPAFQVLQGHTCRGGGGAEGPPETVNRATSTHALQNTGILSEKSPSQSLYGTEHRGDRCFLGDATAAGHSPSAMLRPRLPRSSSQRQRTRRSSPGACFLSRTRFSGLRTPAGRAHPGW